MRAAPLTFPQPIPSTVRVYVGAGLCFDVPRTIYDEATFRATRWRKVMFVGLMQDGQYVISCSREYLMGKDAIALAWVCPMDAIL